MRTLRFTIILWVLAFAVSTLLGPNPARAASAAELNRDAKKALQKLYKQSSSAKALGEKAKAILVFPSVVKAGFMVGGLFGEGVLLQGRTSRSRITTRSPAPTVSRPARRNTVTPCSS